MIRGLEGDETEFLDQVARQQQEISKRRYEEESKEIKGFRVRNESDEYKYKSNIKEFKTRDIKTLTTCTGSF